VENDTMTPTKLEPMRPILRHLFAAVATMAALGACDSTVETEPDDPFCDDYREQAPTQSVTVTIRNEGATPIYLGSTGCSTAIDVLLQDAAGQPRDWQPNQCFFSCELLQESSDWGCTADCPQPPLIFVAPGGSYETSWSGTYREQVAMPAACYAGANPVDASDNTCAQTVVATAGDYTLTVNAWDELQGCENATCGCTPDVNGSCKLETYEAWLDGEPRSASATVSYPSANTIDVVFN
jgi:hypothetical protein